MIINALETVLAGFLPVGKSSDQADCIGIRCPLGEAPLPSPVVKSEMLVTACEVFKGHLPAGEPLFEFVGMVLPAQDNLPVGVEPGVIA